MPLRAVFLHQGSGKGPRLRPTGRSVSGTWMHLQYEPFLWLGHGWSGNGMLSNMNVVIVWAWMFWRWDTLEDEHAYGFGMDALVIRRSRA